MTTVEDATVYGKASGPGPLHIMIGDPDALTAACGVKRAEITRTRPGQWGHYACVRCLVQRKPQALTESESVETELVFIDLLSSLKALEEAEERFTARVREAQPLLVATRRLNPDAAARMMRAGREAGMSLQQIGDLFGVSRERIRQRLAETEVSS